MVSEQKRATERINAEAAAWLARLNGPERSKITEDAFHCWLKLDPEHPRAFERASYVWEVLPSAVSVGEAMKVEVLPSAVSVGEAMKVERERELPESRRYFAPGFAMAAALLMMIGIGLLWSEPQPIVYSTEIGEQHVALLDDGSQVALNTDSEMTLIYSDDTRRVRLERGEAMFDVAHDPKRPFIVMAGDEEIRAIGTKFSVRYEGARVRVTLLEGRVRVSRPKTMDATVAELEPGERMTVARAKSIAIDRPNIQAVTAWRRGEAIFDDTPLSVAAAEFNRYGGTAIIVNDRDIGALRVSGIFATNDPVEFTYAIAELHGLRVMRRGDSVELSR